MEAIAKYQSAEDIADGRDSSLKKALYNPRHARPTNIEITTSKQSKVVTSNVTSNVDLELDSPREQDQMTYAAIRPTAYPGINALSNKSTKEKARHLMKPIDISFTEGGQDVTSPTRSGADSKSRNTKKSGTQSNLTTSARPIKKSPSN